MAASPVLAMSDYLAVGAKATTWRAGDSIIYRYGCHDAEAIIEVVRKRSMALFYIYSEAERCFVVDPIIGATLIKWIAGPFKDMAVERTGSIWEIKDAMDDTEFIWLLDKGGPHERIGAKHA